MQKSPMLYPPHHRVSLCNLKKTLATSVKIRVVNLNDNYPRFNTLFKQIKEKLFFFLFWVSTVLKVQEIGLNVNNKYLYNLNRLNGNQIWIYLTLKQSMKIS